MSSEFYDTIEAITPYAAPNERLLLVEQALKQFPDATIPQTKTTLSVTAKPNGELLYVEVDTTSWMNKAMNLQIGDDVAGEFRGVFASVNSIDSNVGVTLKILGLVNMNAGEILPAQSPVRLGAINGVRTAFVETQNSLGWIKAKAGGSWQPSGTNIDLTVKFFVSDELIAERTITATLDPATGLISTNAQNVENDIGLVVISSNQVFTVRFTYLPTQGGPVINAVEKTLVALNIGLQDGQQGLPGVPGYAWVYGEWDEDLLSTGEGHQIVVSRNGAWYVTKNPDTPYDLNKPPPATPTPAGNNDWSYIANFGNVATGVVGRVRAREGSFISNRYLGADIDTPTIFPNGGTYDAADVMIAAPSHGAKIYTTENGIDPTSGDALWNPNLLLHTETLDNGVWALLTSSTMASDPEPAYNPAITAYKGVGGPSSFGFYQEVLASDAGEFINAGNYFTGSVYVKATDPSIDTVEIALREFEGTTFRSETKVSFQISAVQWTRIWVIHKVVSVPEDIDRLRLEVTCDQSDSGSGNGLFLSMAQLEFGRFPSAYQTVGATRQGIKSIGSVTFKAIAQKFGESSYVRTEAYDITAAGPADPVSKPYASIPGGFQPFEDYPLKVSLFCATSGANIHYTTDNSTPDATDPVFDPANPITVSLGNVYIKAIAIKAGRPDSQILTVGYIPAFPDPSSLLA